MRSGTRLIFDTKFTVVLDAGFASTAHIEGGIDAWKKAGGPVVTG
ncbi:MAG: hypothetical protein QOD09_4692 [Bradyrhizobium sp.]|nr:hypothetical protein [Bradyrhizobium sp.]